MVLWRPTRPSRTNTKKKRCPFHHRGLECKSRKSRDTWSNRQVWPWNTKLSRAKANRVLSKEHTGHSKHPLPTQEMTLHMDITRWSIPKSAAAAKLLQLCLTLCDPIDGSPSGSPVPGLLQARTLEGVAISFSNAWKWKVKVGSLSRVRLLTTPWTADHQAPPSMGFFQARVPEWGAIAFSDTKMQLKMEKLYTISKNKTRSWLRLRLRTPYSKIHT